ncbi:unnamed protein product [Strongylus vulgaris]|uniref:Uncharacterized protein n=1 Tax=Strongylus vulgaris TaxID=40348 RepID=A0A3P7LNM7_STRVU|nr:unnamed protein product [Strongylus vulgaris]
MPSKDLFGYNPLLCAVKAKALKCVEEIRNAGGVIDIPQFKLGVAHPQIVLWCRHDLVYFVAPQRLLALYLTIFKLYYGQKLSPYFWGSAQFIFAFSGVDLCLAAAHGDVEQLRCWEAAGSELVETDYDRRTALHVVIFRRTISQY